MRLFYASDVHGSERCWRKFLNAATFYQADILIMGGDLTGKVLVPLVEERDGQFKARVFERTVKVKNGADLAALEKRIRFNGFYPHRCTQAEYQQLSVDAALRERVIFNVMLAELRRWMAIADEKLKGTSVRCFVMAGNDDPWEIDQVIASETVENPDGRVVALDGYQMLSSSWANPTPWDSPREAPEDQLNEIFDELAQQLDSSRWAIFNLHAPPFDSGLDVAAELDQSLAVKRIGGQPNLVPVGSRAVRNFIEERQPVLALHGHIHESRFAAKLGATVCLNPGSSYADGVVDGALVELERGSVTNYQFVSG